MIKIQSVRIRELRGIRDLILEPKGKSFVIHGPNGSGKSGVVDAIQFGLTGDISRLSGKGTAGLTVLKHGPHVDRRDDPGAAEVTLELYIPEQDKKVVLTRNVKTAKTFTLTPDDPEARALLEEVADHPELTLSRREIIKYIIVEAGERSKEIQELLKLDDIGNIRAVLSTTKNRLAASLGAAETAVANARDALRRHIDAKALSDDLVLEAVNPRRKLLGLSEIAKLEADTDVAAGVLEGGPKDAFNKQTALRDVAALGDVATAMELIGKEAAAAVLQDVELLEADPALLEAVTRRSFIERGLALVRDDRCPLCDMPWADAEHLKTHLAAKLAKSDEAEVLQKRLLGNGAKLATEARRVGMLLDNVVPHVKLVGQEQFLAELVEWRETLTSLSVSLGSVDEIVAQKDGFAAGWLDPPAGLKTQVEAVTEAVKARPDQSATVEAQTFLTLAQDRLKTCRQAYGAERTAKAAADRGRLVYDTYCNVTEGELTALYAAVEGDFSAYYREINGDDEKGFKAELKPSEGKLDLDVAFYDKGMFPPGAYHSEGHQDGMGVCLYLALMKRLLGTRFRFALLDDVVMSVDRDHRKQFCRLLKTRFPETQFIITTHDRVWAKQMQSEGLVEPKGGVEFYGWSVQSGPIHGSVAEVWEQIEADLAKNDVSSAAGRLRRHMESVAAELADSLAAAPPYRGDFSYDLGDLFPAVIRRHGDLLGMAAKAANSWNKKDVLEQVDALKTARKAALTRYGDENWVVNKAIHYNEWADFTVDEFRDVVIAFKGVLTQFGCANPVCTSWLEVEPKRGEAQTLRCPCATISLNLRPK